MPSILTIVADNPALLEALREVFLGQFEPSRVVDVGATDELLGQQARARMVGIIAVDMAFKEIEKYKTSRVLPDSPNPAR